MISARKHGDVGQKAPAGVAEAQGASYRVSPATSGASWINVEALTQSILSMQQLRPNDSLAEQVKKGVEFYEYCVTKGLITSDGEGPGDLKGAA